MPTKRKVCSVCKRSLPVTAEYFYPRRSGRSKFDYRCRECTLSICKSRPANDRDRMRQLWRNMINRCTKPTERGYQHYGGKGIRVCAQWCDFNNFLADMPPRPSLKHSLDRINNDGDYEPGNVRWSTKEEQNRNQARNRILEFKGARKCVTDWEIEGKFGRGTVGTRLKKGWSVARALTTPSLRNPDSGVSL